MAHTCWGNLLGSDDGSLLLGHSLGELMMAHTSWGTPLGFHDGSHLEIDGGIHAGEHPGLLWDLYPAFRWF